ncbi:hypothetical protein CEUSTIGMA_g10462.t1 [Chlamydomonas eustigma]|uniref:Uncharacterized protein n=1 Tax=Chlamydomonas eustigma TaxID=1157962 RepID=A0A250XJ40_9CHLO|nr:hypothetical protein CEUSTIGMA_g10462.t1 [Chlamydomonas eustigma]|eukprot:GAX83036.1 hypothetical protein CEUSTIGMA_g10462.t1 [Chlamydomonas eustigma]
MFSTFHVLNILRFTLFWCLLLSTYSADNTAIELADPGSGPTLCFLKLAPSPRRTKAEVETLSSSWAKLLNEKFPGVSYKLLAVDRETIAFQSAVTGMDTSRFRDFFLELDVVYEVLIEAEVFRRPGKVPLQALKASLVKEARKEKRTKFFQFFKSKKKGIRADHVPKRRRRNALGKTEL